jgi:hypothetical protein
VSFILISLVSCIHFLLMFNFLWLWIDNIHVSLYYIILLFMLCIHVFAHTASNVSAASSRLASSHLPFMYNVLHHYTWVHSCSHSLPAAHSFIITNTCNLINDIIKDWCVAKKKEGQRMAAHSLTHTFTRTTLTDWQYDVVVSSCCRKVCLAQSRIAHYVTK